MLAKNVNEDVRRRQMSDFRTQFKVLMIWSVGVVNKTKEPVHAGSNMGSEVCILGSVTILLQSFSSPLPTLLLLFHQRKASFLLLMNQMLKCYTKLI